MAGGRQREFDKQEALEKAMQMFWQNGYAGTSLADLTACMGLNKPSLYSAFGNKERLFTEALEFYLEQYVRPNVMKLVEGEGPLSIRLKAFMAATLQSQFSEDAVKGCFISCTGTESVSAKLPDMAQEKFKAVRDFTTQHLERLFEEAIQNGQIRMGHQADILALSVMLFLHGAAQLSRAGNELQPLEAVLEQFLASFPFSDQ
jgi:AcrR family transcriptional regulator